jgi:DNA-binding beta-propeller fold protein YncE
MADVKRSNAFNRLDESPFCIGRPNLRSSCTTLFCLTLLTALLGGGSWTYSAATAAPQSASRQSSGHLSATLTSAPVGKNPDWLDVNPDTDTIYVANGGIGGSRNTVSVINGRTCRTADIGGCKHSSPAIKVGPAPLSLAVDPITDTIYVTTVNNTVAVIDGATCSAEVRSGCGQQPPEVPVGNTPSSVVIDQANHTAYVTNAGSNDVSMINTLLCSASTPAGCSTLHPPTVAVGIGPADVAVDELTHSVYVTNDDENGHNGGNTMSVFDASTCNAVTQSGCADQALVTVGVGPLALAVDERTNTIFVGNYPQDLPDGAPSKRGSVWVINGQTCDAVDLPGCSTHSPGAVRTEWGPNALEMDESAHTLYVSNVLGDNTSIFVHNTFIDPGTLSVINTEQCNGAHLAACRRTVVGTIRTGEQPSGVAVNPRTNTLYVSNLEDNDVSVIDAARCDADNRTGCLRR